MKVTKISLLLAVAWLSLTSLTTLNACHSTANTTASTANKQQTAQSVEKANAEVVMGAARTSEYVPLLKGKRVALLSNHSGLTSDGSHVLDLMLAKGINVTTIFG